MKNKRFGFGRAFWAMMLLSISAGCSSSGPQSNLTLTSGNQKLDFQHNFSAAYFAKNDTGDTDILLLDDSSTQQATVGQQTAQPAIKQLVHIRVFWQPIWGIKADHPAGTNASIEWYIIGEKSPKSDILVYSGSGLVSVSESGQTATADVQTAWMTAAAQPGRMVDPLGPSKLNGKITAIRDQAQAKSLLDQIKSLDAQIEAALANPQATNEPKKMSFIP